jgi:hypothetical protein
VLVNTPIRGATERTSRQGSIVGLRVEVYLDHLAPTPWPENPENVPQVGSPSVRVDSAGHQLAVNEVKVPL